MNDEIVDESAIESLEHFREVEPLRLQMEELGRAELGDLNSICHALRSLNGAAGFLGLTDIQRLPHGVETLLMRLRAGELDYGRPMSDPVLRVIDELRGTLEALPETGGEFPEEVLATGELPAGDPAAAAGGTPSPPEPAGPEGNARSGRIDGVIHLEHGLLQVLETRSLLSPQVSGVA